MRSIVAFKFIRRTANKQFREEKYHKTQFFFIYLQKKCEFDLDTIDEEGASYRIRKSERNGSVVYNRISSRESVPPPPIGRYSISSDRVCV